MPLIRDLHSLPTPLIALLLTSLLPTASATGAAGTVDTPGFWLGFSLLLVISAAESAFSVIWTRIRFTFDGIHPGECSHRVCGREITVSSIDPQEASQIAIGAAGCNFWWGIVDTKTDGLTKKVVVDRWVNLELVLTLLIRRFNPAMSMAAPGRLVNAVKDLVKPGNDKTVVRVYENVIDLLVGLTDVFLGMAVLALNPSSPQELYDTFKDPKAPMTLQNYTTLFMLYWLLGAVLLLCIIPQRSARMSIQIFGWPWAIAFAVTALANIALFSLGCWKIDFARRHHTPWTPMLSYWISGVSTYHFLLCGVDVFDAFGTVGLVFMLTHTFN